MGRERVGGTLGCQAPRCREWEQRRTPTLGLALTSSLLTTRPVGSPFPVGQHSPPCCWKTPSRFPTPQPGRKLGPSPPFRGWGMEAQGGRAAGPGQIQALCDSDSGHATSRDVPPWHSGRGARSHPAGQPQNSLREKMDFSAGLLVACYNEQSFFLKKWHGCNYI